MKQTKTVYLYNPETNEPTCAYEAQESPLEPGKFITPTHCTDVCPPSIGKDESLFYDGKGDWIIKKNPVPTKEQELEAALERLRMGVRRHMSEVAKSQPERFNSISEAKSYTGIENKFIKISGAFVVWGAEVQHTTNSELAKRVAAKKPLPTIEELIKILPVFVRP